MRNNSFMSSRFYYKASPFIRIDLTSGGGCRVRW
ncbi:hypothetical protein A2U01_0104101, partial [Trifolium medium]|nr:hypothetical protein [Trifolium medium]